MKEEIATTATSTNRKATRLARLKGLRAWGVVLLLAFFAGVGYAQVGGSFDLSWSTIDGGGGTFSTGGSLSLGGTIGQPDAGTASGGAFTLDGGFWGGAGAPTPTATATSTPTRTATPSATSTPGCIPGGNYTPTPQTTASFVPANSFVNGSGCNGCVVPITLPFPYTLYDTTFTTANVSSRGNIQFTSSNSLGNSPCLPTNTVNNVIMPYWDNLNTFIDDTMGVYTSTTGTAPNRIFAIRWHAGYEANDAIADFELLLYEGQYRFDFVYGTVTQRGFNATIGAQEGTGSRYVQWSCSGFTVSPPNRLIFSRCPLGPVGSEP